MTAALPALVYVSGPPATGKTTLTAELTRDCGRDSATVPFAFDVLTVDRRRVGVELGRRRGTFSGTDALSLSVQPRAVAWVRDRPAALVLAEGDRLANPGFLDAAAGAGYAVTLIALTLDPDVRAARAAGRAGDGPAQSPGWVAGRVTKARNLAATATSRGWRLLRVDAAQPPPVLAAYLYGEVPALRGLHPAEARAPQPRAAS